MVNLNYSVLNNKTHIFKVKGMEMICSTREGELITKNMFNEITKEERNELDVWLKASEENRKIFSLLNDPKYLLIELMKLRKKEEFWKEAAGHSWGKVKRTHKKRHRLYFALILLGICLMIFLYLRMGFVH